MVPDNRVSLLSIFSAFLSVGIVLSLYLPMRRGEEVYQNEVGAISLLTTLHQLEIAHREGRDPEETRFAFLQELLDSPNRDVAARARRLAKGRVQGIDLCRFGYRFRFFLPDVEGHGVSFDRREEINQAKASEHYACYAWPMRFGETGRRAFLLVRTGDVLSTENQKRQYNGQSNPPRPGAGFRAADPDRIVDTPAATRATQLNQGIDGQFWHFAERHATRVIP